MARKIKKRLKNKKILQEKYADSKKIKRYRKQRCKFVSDGNRCRNYAVGKSTLCKQHGGDPVIKENLFKDSELALVGLNTSYNPVEHPTLFIDYSRMGMSEVEIAAEFKVSVATLKSWTEKFEMFNTAYEIGKALHESWWLQQGKSGLFNRGFNTGLFKFLTANKLGYAEKVESRNLNMNVHGVLMVPDKMSEEEWENEEDVIDVSS